MLGLVKLVSPKAPSGDLYVTLDVAPHEVFKRDGADTYVTIPVPYPVMVLGGPIQVPTVHGEEEFMVPRSTESGAVHTLHGKGVAHIRGRGRQGDHHLRLVVDVPTSLRMKRSSYFGSSQSTKKVGVQERGFWQGLFDKLTNTG